MVLSLAVVTTSLVLKSLLVERMRCMFCGLWLIITCHLALLNICALNLYKAFNKMNQCSFLANVNSSSGSLYVVVRPSVVCLSVVCRLSSVVCNVRAPYSGDWNFRQCFYAIWYLGHPSPLCKNFTEIVPGEPLHLGLNARGVAKYSDFGPIGRYISETVQDRC